MATAILEHRVDRLEDMMADLTANVKQLSVETRAFQQEVRASTERTDRYIAEIRQESRAYADQTDRHIAEIRQESREMNRRWGDISNSLGMLVENIVAPSIPRVLRDVLGCPEGASSFWRCATSAISPMDARASSTRSPAAASIC